MPLLTKCKAHFNNVERGTKNECTLIGIDDIHYTKGCMANSILQPCGLGCQLLGPRCCTCLGTKLNRNYLLWVRPHEAQHFFRTGWERTIAQNPSATNGDLGRDQGVLVSPR